MRRRASAWCTLASFFSCGLLLLSPRDAYARDCTNPLTNACINSDTYWPNPGPMPFATINGTETVGSGLVGFGLVATYLSRPVKLVIASPGPGGSDQFVVDNQVTGNFLFAYGVTDRLQLDFALPVTFIQTGAGTSPITGGDDLSDTAVRDLRFGLALALVPRKRIDPAVAGDTGGVGNTFALTTRLTLSAPTGDSADFAGERSAVFAPSLTGDYRRGIFFAGVDLGARLRPVTEFSGARVGSQITTGLGAGATILDRERLAFTAEARGYFNFAEQHESLRSALGTSSTGNGKIIIPAEWLVAARTAPLRGGDVAFFFGGGGPIPTGDPAITVPRFRFVLGAVYAPTARDTDGDGILDKNDLCPTRAGPRGGDRPGCPSDAEPGGNPPANNEETKP